MDAVRARGVGDGRDEGVWWEAADVAAFAMMVAEVSTESVYPDRGGSR